MFSRILAVLPDLSTIQSIEKGFDRGDDNFVKRALETRLSEGVESLFIPIDAQEEDVNQIIGKLQTADLVLAFVFNARHTPGQRFLLEELKKLRAPTIFLLIRNPFDLELLEAGHTTVITYGYRKVQIAAAIDVVAGKIQARGKVPFEMPTGKIKRKA